MRDLGSIPESGRSPGAGHGNPLQCSCLKNPMDRGAWWARVYGVTESRTRLSDSHTVKWLQDRPLRILSLKLSASVLQKAFQNSEFSTSLPLFPFPSASLSWASFPSRLTGPFQHSETFLLRSFFPLFSLFPLPNIFLQKSPKCPQLLELRLQKATWIKRNPQKGLEDWGSRFGHTWLTS